MLYYHGFECNLGFTPKRIISVVPSQTELLYYLSVEPLAQTIFCVHPKKRYKSAIKIGGTKKLNIEKIVGLKPDLIIGNKEENDREQIEELSKYVPVWLSDIYTINDALAMIKEVGRLVDKESEANKLIEKLNFRFLSNSREKPSKTCIYLIWKKPYMAAGQNTFINSVLSVLGYTNLMPASSRYPEVSAEQLIDLNPDVILLSSEPFPFQKKHVEDLQSILPNCEIKLVNGELFSWYGPRLLKTFKVC